MSMAESATGYRADSITREKLVQDLKAVVSDAEELLKATAQQTVRRSPSCAPRRKNR